MTTAVSSRKNPPAPSHVKTMLAISPKDWAAIDRDAMAEWVRELREGDQAQTRAYLKIVDVEEGADEGYKVGRCCMGVACDLFTPRVPDLDISEHNFGSFRRKTVAEYDGSYAEMPESIGYGVLRLPPHHRNNPSVVVWSDDLEKWVATSVAELNDELRLGFPQIADAIEFTYLREED